MPERLNNCGWCRQADIELQIPRHMHTSSIGADRLQPRRVLFGLCQKKVHICEHAPQSPPKALIAWPRPVGDTSVHHSHTRSAAVRDPQEIRPELRLCEHNQFRPQRAHIRPDREREIHWEVKDILLAEPLARQILTGVRRSRDHNPRLRELTSYPPNQPSDRQHLTDRDRMDPYDRLPGATLQLLWNLPHTFRESAPVLPMAQNLVEPKRQAEQHRQPQGQTVEDITQVQPF